MLLVAGCRMVQCCIIRQFETLGVFPCLNGTIYDVAKDMIVGGGREKEGPTHLQSRYLAVVTFARRP